MALATGQITSQDFSAFIGHTGVIIAERTTVGMAIGEALMVVVLEELGKPVDGTDLAQWPHPDRMVVKEDDKICSCSWPPLSHLSSIPSSCGS